MRKRKQLRLGETVGIIGGGQLARMLSMAAQNLGLEPVVLVDRTNDPAAQVVQRAIVGGTRDQRALDLFFSATSRVIFENEFVSCELLEMAAAEKGVEFIPGLKTMALLQDKTEQKKVLRELGIPTTDFVVCEKAGEVENWLKTVRERFGDNCVLKWARNGYDGKGTFFLGTGSKSLEDANRFCSDAQARGIRVYAEERIDFVRELAQISCYSTAREFLTYPLVISEQAQGVCLWVTGPAVRLGTKKRLEDDARAHARRLAEALPLHGTFAIEFFETRDGRLLVNEIAPRVHNTGHFSLDCAETSQFENHLRAVLGLPLSGGGSAPAFAMLNLIGPPGVRKKSSATRLPGIGARFHLHWYGKDEIRPGRKMGHLNGSADTSEELRTLIEEMQHCHEAWVADLKAGAIVDSD